MNNKNWMGRYKPLMDEISRHDNIIIGGSKIKHDIGDGIICIAQEWQILEYIIYNNNDENFNMNIIAKKLQIPQSTFSKSIAKFEKYSLIEKYTANNNKKNIIIKPTKKSIDIYLKRVKEVSKNYSTFFNGLDFLSDKQLEKLTQAFKTQNDQLERYDSKEKELVLVKKTNKK